MTCLFRLQQEEKTSVVSLESEGGIPLIRYTLKGMSEVLICVKIKEMSRIRILCHAI